ncbi:MAG: condensation domain-containing protein, partial [Trichodesmium sp. St15_bin1_1]|nr:condensation domain-containing protein [Trichodesmium sp. St15_bin1_1]
MTNDRPLVDLEKALELLQRETNSLHVVVVGKIKGFLEPEVLRRSLLFVQLRHPLLNSHIVGPLDHLMFKTEGTEKIPLEVILNSEPEYWQTIFVNELNTKLENKKVLLRATLIKPTEKSTTNYLITRIHHGVIDGISAVHLYSEILSFCQKIVSENQIPEFEKLGPPPCLEKIIADYTVENNTESLISELELPIDTLPFEKYVPFKQRTCGLIQKQLNASLTQQLIQRCKSEKVTVQGAICSAMMLALAKYLEPEDKEFYFSCYDAVDMGRRLNYPIGNEQMTFLVSSLVCFHTVNQKMSFWDLAKQATEEIQAKLKTPEIYHRILAFGEGVNIILENPEKTISSVFVSNIGKVKISSNYGQFELEEISFGASNKMFGSTFTVFVSTFQDQATFNFVYTQPLVSQTVIEKLIKDSMEYLVT